MLKAFYFTLSRNNVPVRVIIHRAHCVYRNNLFSRSKWFHLKVQETRALFQDSKKLRANGVMFAAACMYNTVESAALSQLVIPISQKTIPYSFTD